MQSVDFTRMTDLYQSYAIDLQKQIQYAFAAVKHVMKSYMPRKDAELHFPVPCLILNDVTIVKLLCTLIWLTGLSGTGHAHISWCPNQA
jgi:hypothetical protein